MDLSHVAELYMDYNSGKNLQEIKCKYSTLSSPQKESIYNMKLTIIYAAISYKMTTIASYLVFCFFSISLQRYSAYECGLDFCLFWNAFTNLYFYYFIIVLQHFSSPKFMGLLWHLPPFDDSHHCCWQQPWPSASF